MKYPEIFEAIGHNPIFLATLIPLAVFIITFILSHFPTGRKRKKKRAGTHAGHISSNGTSIRWKYKGEGEKDRAALITAAGYLRKTFPNTSFDVVKGNVWDTVACFVFPDGSTYELADKPALGYISYVLFDGHTGKVIADWPVPDMKDDEDGDKGQKEKAYMAMTRLQSIYPNTRFIVNYWDGDSPDSWVDDIAYLISYKDAQFQRYAVSSIESDDASLVLVHDMQTGNLIDSFIVSEKQHPQKLGY